MWLKHKLLALSTAHYFSQAVFIQKSSQTLNLSSGTNFKMTLVFSNGTNMQSDMQNNTEDSCEHS